MIGSYRGLLGLATLIAGLVPSDPPPEPEVDLAEAAKVMDDLAAAGIASPDVLEAAGSPARFIVTARKCLAAQSFLASFGEPHVTDVGRLLAPSKSIERDEALEAAALAQVIDDLPTFHGRPLARRLPDGSITSTRPTIDEARRDPNAFARYVEAGIVVDARGFRENTRVTLDRPGAASEAPLRYSAEPRLHPAGRCTCDGAGAGTCGWCEMNRRREIRDARPVMRDQQRKAGRARARRKARRGW